MTILLLISTALIGADADRGAAVFKMQCARCHGADGAGIPGKADRPLGGDQSIPQLAKLIAETMPEDKPGTCTGADADAVAAYLHAEFYAPLARARRAPARAELQRLTAVQHRHALADLLGGFRAAPEIDTGVAGLHGSYYQADRANPKERKIRRRDARIKFDFGDQNPDPKIVGKAFAARWEGVLLPPETGEYELIVRSPNAYRLWLNEADYEHPLIDGAVRSNGIPERRASARLLGGRAYSFNVEWMKSGRGGEKLAALDVRWKPPRGVEETIPARCLAAGNAPQQFVPETPFPPDDRSLGWVRGTAISPEWRQAVTAAALEAADWVAARADQLAGANPKDSARSAKLQAFAKTFVGRAFRRPLAPPELELYVERPFRGAKDLDFALRKTVALALSSPRFLYRDALGAHDDFEVAARLAFMLWDALPDEPLRQAAERGQLKTPAQVAAQADRMLRDRRAKHKLLGFAHHWLGVEEGRDLAKDPKAFPDFDAAAIADLRASLDLFVVGVLEHEAADYRQLLLADTTPVTARLAKLYGVAPPPAEAEFIARALPGPRAGAITHPYLLAAFAYAQESSPIHRGVFLARGLLGVSLRPPPEAIAPLPAEQHPGLTTRQRVELQTKGASCQTCHAVINPLGFTLEQFDALGRHRTEQFGKPIPPGGQYLTKAGAKETFGDAKVLGRFLAGSPEAQESFVQQLFHHLVQQPVRAYGPNRLAELRQRFAANRYNIRKLAAEIAVAAALPTTPPAPPEKSP